MLRGSGLFTSLLVSEMAGFVLLFAFGYLTPAELVAKDGLIANAFDGMLSSIIFILFIFVMVSLISEAGVLDAILVWMRKYAKSEKSAEIAPVRWSASWVSSSAAVLPPFLSVVRSSASCSAHSKLTVPVRLTSWMVLDVASAIWFLTNPGA